MGERPARAGRSAIGLRGGTGSLASVIRARDEAGIAGGHVEVDSPSLDDVFADATGRRLEGAGTKRELSKASRGFFSTPPALGQGAARALR